MNNNQYVLKHYKVLLKPFISGLKVRFKSARFQVFFSDITVLQELNFSNIYRVTFIIFILTTDNLQKIGNELFVCVLDLLTTYNINT